MIGFIVDFNECSAETRATIDSVAEKTVHFIEHLSTLVYKELKKIEDLSSYDIEIAHEWLNAHIDKASTFIDIDDKRSCMDST
ncbi:hypothetical protein AAC387_Pa02g1631 [Persea americana]